MISVTFDSAASPGRLAQLYSSRARALAQAVRQAQQATAADALRLAVKLSSGPLTTAYLRAAARSRGAGLYSVRDPDTSLPSYIVNAQTGRFRVSWHALLQSTPGGSEVVIVNDSPEARFMVGTSKMIARPIAEKIIEVVRPLHFERLARLKTQALKNR